MKTLEEIQEAADKLATEMRSINIRSWGLKPRIHDDWCRRARGISDALKALLEPEVVGDPVEDVLQEASKQPPPPPPSKLLV